MAVTWHNPQGTQGPQTWQNPAAWMRAKSRAHNAESGLSAGDTEKPAPAAPLGFADLLDVINPLQHIPVVGTIYRAVTGDEIGAPARLAGGALYGGVLGLAGAAVNLVAEAATGHDIGDHVLAMLRPGPEPQLAQARLAPDSAATLLAAQEAVRR